MVRKLVVGAVGAVCVVLLVYAGLFLRSMVRHGWALDHLTALLLLWQTQTAATFALLAALIGATVILHQTHAAECRENMRRHHERTALAAALLAEITSILRIFEEHKVVDVYRQLQEIMRRRDAQNASLPSIRKCPAT